jgi:hypothetical protein
MRINKHDNSNIMSSFPKIKLSYVKHIHNKVSSANMFLAIPKGVKHFMWFRTLKNKYVCICLEIDGKNRSIKSIKIKNCCFDERLCMGSGTILYGTLFKYDTIPLFTIEDIFIFKGDNLDKHSQSAKWCIIQSLFTRYIQQNTLGNDDVTIGIPVITKSRDEMDEKIASIPYTIYCIQHRYYQHNKYYYNECDIIRQNICANFLIKAGIRDDIYILYTKDVDTPFGHAVVSNYKKSVLMNGIFRNIRENTNLDLLEESEDEDDFENINDDKYIEQGKECIMECFYNRRYKLWEPMRITSGHITSTRDVIRKERNG